MESVTQVRQIWSIKKELNINPANLRNDHRQRCIMYAYVLNYSRWLCVRMIAIHLGINKMTTYTLITERLQMRRICAKLVPKVRLKLASWSTTIWPRAALQRFRNLPMITIRSVLGGFFLVFQSEHNPQRTLQWDLSRGPK